MDALPFAVVGVTVSATDRVTVYPSGGSTCVDAHLVSITTVHVVMHVTSLAREPYGFPSPVEGLDGEFSLDLYIGSHLYIPSNGCTLNAAFSRMGFH